MNWELIAWVAKVLATAGTIKLVFIGIKKLFSTDTVEKVSKATGKSISKTNKQFKRYLKNKAEQRKAEEVKPVVTIR